VDTERTAMTGTERPSQPHFTCPVCGMTSYNANDIKFGYCGNCHDYTGAPS
jgi:ribosomal protein L37E